jgi:hypothetical protein
MAIREAVSEVSWMFDGFSATVAESVNGKKAHL